MNTETYVWCFLAGLLGLLFYLFAVKIPGVKTAAKVANMPFSYGQYFQDDLAAIMASLFTVLILLVVLDEAVALKPVILPYLKAGFVFVGYTGSSLLVKIMGKAQGKINDVVDEKTDIADKK
jgi:hypothetical protein